MGVSTGNQLVIERMMGTNTCPIVHQVCQKSIKTNKMSLQLEFVKIIDIGSLFVV
jgi:hypothetical protein